MASRMSSKPKSTRLSRTTTQPTADGLLHFFNQSPDLLCIAGFDGIFKRLNPAWSPLLGWSNTELQARPFLEFVHPDDRAATLAVMDQLDAGAATISFENRYRCKDSSWKWLHWTASPLLDQQEIYAIARDVTRQKRLELHLYRIAQEALGNAAKHSAARHVTLLLHHGGDTLRLTVADDGHGLPPSSRDAHGMGLDSMRYRAHALGGELTLESLPDEGTVVACEIPTRPFTSSSP